MSAIIHILGHIGRDPVLLDAGEHKVCTFNVATNRRGRDGADRTVWYKVEIWSKSGQAAAKCLSKGRRVYVTGTHDEETYTAADGAPRHVHLVKNATWEFADSAEGATRREVVRPAPTATPTAPAGAVDGEEPPF